MRYEYAGEEQRTRGDYGEDIRTVVRGNFDGDNFTPSSSGEDAAAWDSSFGWRFLATWDNAVIWGWVGQPLED